MLVAQPGMPTSGVKLQIGDRELWLVPAARVESWSLAHAQQRLAEAAQQWTGRLELARLADRLPPSDADPVERVAEAFERGELVAVRDATGEGLAPIFGGARRFDWDDLPMLRRLSPAARDARTRIDGGRGTAQPLRPGGTTPGDDHERDEAPTTFVAFRVVDQSGRPLAGTWRCGPAGGGALDERTVRVDGLPVDTQAVPLQLRSLQRGAHRAP